MDLPGRQQHGWFGSGTAPISANSAAQGRESDDHAIPAVAHGAIAALPRLLRARFENQLQSGTLATLTEAMQGWRNGAHLPAEQFRAHFLGPYGSEAVAAHLRAIGQILGTSAFPKDLAVASEHLAQVVQLVGPDNFARFATTARDLAKAPLLRGSSPPLVKAQELLLEPRPFLFADPPKGVLPRLMERIPGQSGKEAAKGVPSWARGIARRVGETPRQYAKRVMDDQYGAGKWEEDPERQGEFRKIQKHGSRAFRNPMTAAPPPDPGRQQPTA